MDPMDMRMKMQNIWDTMDRQREQLDAEGIRPLARGNPLPKVRVSVRAELCTDQVLGNQPRKQT